MKRVTIFADVDTALNPYVILFKKMLEHQGLKVKLERIFGLRWLISKGKDCEAINLQWINQAYTPSRGALGSGPVKRLSKNRLGNAILEALRLLNFSTALLFAKLQGKIIVYTVHNLYEFGPKSWRGRMQLKLAHYIVFLLSNHIHVHNIYSRRFIEAHYRGKFSFAVVPHGNYIGFYPNQVSKPEACRELGLPDDSFVFLFLGLLRPYKGLGELFDAFKRLESPSARLLVAGRVFSDANFKLSLFNMANSDSRIKLVPEFIPDDDIQLYMNAADICVLPYKLITTSGTAALSLSFGKPIIAPDYASFPEIICPDTGILYSTADPNALYTALKEAMTRSWSESRVIDYAHRFDWHKLGPEMAALYS